MLLEAKSWRDEYRMDAEYSDFIKFTEDKPLDLSARTFRPSSREQCMPTGQTGKNPKGCRGTIRLPTDEVRIHPHRLLRPFPGLSTGQQIRAEHSEQRLWSNWQ